MEPIIQSLGFKAGAGLEDFVKEKLSTIKYDKIVGTEVTLYLASAPDPNNNVCEIKLQIPGNDLFIKKATPHFETSVNECVDVLKLKIGQLKEKQADRRQADATQIQDALLEAGSSDDDELEA